jgi:hypothetical protein
VAAAKRKKDVKKVGDLKAEKKRIGRKPGAKTKKTAGSAKPSAKRQAVRKQYRPRIGSRVSVSMKGLVTLGVLDSIVGEMANVTVGCLGVWTKNEIVPLALVKKATETEAKYYDAFDRYMSECYGKGRRDEEAATAHAAAEHVPEAMQVVEQASDVQADKSFKDGFVKVESIDEAAAIILGGGSDAVHADE